MKLNRQAIRGWKAYALAVACVTAAFLTRLELRGALEQRGIYVTFYAAVAISSYLGGIRPGLLATGLSVITTALWTVPLRASNWSATQADVLGALLFGVNGMIITFGWDWGRGSTERARAAGEMSLARQRRESEARHAAELARSNSDLEQFAYIVSHDLQEPMRTVKGFAGLLRPRLEGRLSEAEEQHLRFLVAGVDRMQTLLNDLLLYSRVTSEGTIPAPVDSRAVLARAIEDLHGAIGAQQAHITLSGDFPQVLADGTQLGQVFGNLLRNAIRFSKRDVRPTIHIRANVLDLECHFSVTDNGIGMAPADLKRIFVIFQRLHTEEEYEGTGIGLAICKKIIERHAGRIWVESRLGEGSSFCFTLPIA